MLAAILTAVFINVRRTAKRTSCLSNLRNIDVAMKLYTADHDNRYPPHPWLAMPDMPENRRAFIASLNSYKVNDDILFCPDDGHKKTNFEGEWHDFSLTSYILIDMLLASNAKPEDSGFWRLSPDSVEKPSEVVQSLDQTWITVDDKAGKRERFSAHGKYANAVYVDGHAKNLKWIEP